MEEALFLNKIVSKDLKVVTDFDLLVEITEKQSHRLP